MDAAVLAQENALLKARLTEVEAALAESQEANRRLEDILRTSQREKFGKRSEKMSPDQFNLPLEDAELAQGVLEAAQEKAEAAMQRARGEEPRKPKRNRGHLPSHLPRVERVIEPASTRCPCGCGEMAKIGEDVSERLDVIPAQFRVLVTRRPKYACRRCSRAVAQAHAPEHVVPGGLPTELFFAWIIVSKFGDHLPFYRQAEIFKRQGIDLDRGTLGNWVGRACFHLMPIINHMKAHLRGADRIFVDETRAPVLDPGRKATKSGFFWAVVSDDRGHGGVGPPIVLFHYAPGRGKEHPLKFLAGYRGRFLQCDAYQSCNALTEIARDTGPWQLVYCWTHVRRRFVKRFESDRSPIAEEMLRQIALLYQIEKTVRGKDAEVRLVARREHSAPIIAALKPWLEAQNLAHPAEIPAGRGYPLHPRTLARPDPLPQRWHPRAGHQPRRKSNQTDCPDAEKRALRGQRGRRRELGHARLAGRNLQDVRREPRGLPRRHPPSDPRRPSAERHRRPYAVALKAAVKPRRVGSCRSAYHYPGSCVTSGAK